MNTTAMTREKCKSCGRAIEVCEFCERHECPAAICYFCMYRELKQTLPQPHVHGG